MTPIWISTSKAARMVGYSRDGFRRKFYASFEGMGAAFALDNGYVKWLRVAVLSIVPEGEERMTLEKAG